MNTATARRQDPSMSTDQEPISQAHSPLAIANEFIKRANAEGRKLTHMQLQKLVYLANGWMLAAGEKPMVEDDPEAWEFGPVYRRLFEALKRYGKAPVENLIKWGDDTPFSLDDDGVAEESLSPEECNIIDMVWNAYGDMEGFQLSALTHQEGSPWNQTYERGRNRRIPQSLIYEHFRNLMTSHGEQTASR